MNCLSELVCSMHADGALTSDEAAAVERHVAECAACRERVAALADERALLTAALAAMPAPARVPAFRAPAARSTGALAAAGMLVALAAGPLVLARLREGFGTGQVPAWLNPLATSLLVDFGIDAGISFFSRGNQIMASIIETIGTSVVLALFAFAAFAVLKRRGGGAALLACLGLAVIVMPRPGEALEVRRSENDLTVPADETIDDTLVAFGDRIEIDGTVTGDVVAFGRRIVVRGTVEGQLFTFARTVNVDGNVGNGLIGFAQSLELGQADIARNVFGFAQEVTLFADSRVRENAVLFGQNLELAGPVDRDVMGFANEMDVRGSVGGDLTARGSRLIVEAPARIGGSVRAFVPGEDDVDISASAVIGGSVETEIAEADIPQNPLATGSFYLGQALRLAAGFLTGFALLWLVPSLRATSLEDGMAALTAAGLGLVALVAAPIIGIIIAITIIGLPIAILGVILWLIGLYFAKIVLAHFFGRRLFEATGQQRHFALALLVGLLLVIVAVNLPFIGGLVNFVLTIMGLGMLLLWLVALIQGRPPARGSAAHAA